ncbi:MAG TPA: hypothetical protein VG324_22445 [Blastocatellia bacterium]|nr:hypothetical protein [Blastocatellia bacterium]
MMNFFLGCLGLIAVSAVYSLHASCAQTQSFNLAGRWKVEFKFSSDEEHTLRFDAQSDGKGAFLLLDTVSSLLPPAEPTEAQWEQAAPDQATFSGAIEFPIGNVGRNPGTLVFKGKFDSANSISGKVSFFREGQNLKNPATIPAKTGDFTAKRAKTSSSTNDVN